MTATSPQGGNLQQQVLHRYTALMLLKPTWAGELLLVCGLDEDGTALALASNIAGAVCLGIEPDAKHVKAAQRRGACDFAVNTLDEALRTMKNEVRKGRALSVGLHGEIESVLLEVLDRGLAPAVAVNTGDAASPFPQLSELGTKLVHFGSWRESGTITGSVDGDALVAKWTKREEYVLRDVIAGSRAELKAVDADLRLITAEEDVLRYRWLERAPQHFQREQPLCRAAWLGPHEVLGLRANGHSFSPR